MIGKIVTGKSFDGCIKYCLNDKLPKHTDETVMKDRAEVLLFNQCYGNQKELIRQFNEVRQLNPRLSKPVLHITLSLAPGEQLPKDKLMEMCQACARDMGFENNQYVAVHHKDTNHQHLHIVANRVGFDKKTVSDSGNYQKIARYCRKMEQQYQLKQVLSPRQFLSKEQRLLPRQDARKEKLKKDIQQTLQQVKTYAAFEQKMKALGYGVLKGRGIAFIDDKKVRIKGSEVGYSLMKIEKILALKQGTISIPETGSSSKTAEKQPAKEKEPDLLEKHSGQKDDLLSQLMKPEGMPEHLAPELLKRKQKKKKRPQHRL